jgi:hypothetical protein
MYFNFFISCKRNVLFVFKSLMNDSKLKYILPPNALRCLTQQRRKINWGKKGKCSSPLPLLSTLFFLERNTLKAIEATKSCS